MTYEFQGWHTHFLRKIETVKHDCADLAFYARKMVENEPLSPAMIEDIERAAQSARVSLAQIEAIKKFAKLSEMEAA